ncbi:BglII/BstYI family type II restriction endonuclease [Cryobacterium sp. PH31-O1]|uniref:BglII/BstYI family type II restriction endonuclease n=1 Tax=Cryobacterium sp. PH31-O1 TaxID=3046306 RepID=UPI0024B9CF2D|nr:BglII/BstYI family type II restriction endonuclease [Cryobacterium sp. PH31-O1]MDJ0338243.1 BglII/BstYI family type II restriction endonuclease [Cryobacterium sp. PH31-O1]
MVGYEDNSEVHDDATTDGQIPDLPSVVGTPSVDLPSGYKYGVTRYADLILREAFPQRFADLIATLEEFQIEIEELLAGGGSRAQHTARFDATLEKHGWGKRNISIARLIDDKPLHVTRGHEIDMFAVASQDDPYPGIGVEVEWNNKDPFFDRDLLNYQALHREGALAVGVIVTRGPELQRIIGPTIRTSTTATSKKYGSSTTHWNKLIPRVNLGGGGECPLLLIGIEPARVNDFESVQMAFDAGVMVP